MSLRRKKAELLRQTHTHSPNFSKVTDKGFIKKTAARLRLCRFLFLVTSPAPFEVLDFEPCRIRKPFRLVLERAMQTFVNSSSLFIMAVAIYRKFSTFEPCWIRKVCNFTHHGIRRISKKACESTLVSKLPRMDFLQFSTFEPCRIRKPFRFTHHGIRHISKKGYITTLVNKFPRIVI